MNSQTKRPKGFVNWRPRQDTLRILDQVQEIFETYKNNLPLTARQIFYRLVGAYGYPKEELAYNRLCEYLVRARRAGVISFANIRDDGVMTRGGPGDTTIEEWWTSAYADYVRYRHDRTEGQPVHVEVWCEAGGMVPQLARVASPYDVSVYSTGGFSSVTVTHEVASRVVRRDRPTVFLHIGDLDPSGQSIYESMSEDIDTFVLQYKNMRETDPERFSSVQENCGFIYARVALTEEQVTAYNLPTAPPKASDKRSAKWVGETCQAEAMAPDDLAEELRDAIREQYDLPTYHKILDKEEKDWDSLRKEMKTNLPHRKEIFSEIERRLNGN